MKQKKQGIYYLLKSYTGQKHDLGGDLCWSNSASKGVAVRTQFGTVEKTAGVYDWSYLDSASSLASSVKKKWSILVTAGVSTPAWMQSLAQGITVTTESGDRMWMPLPWDSVFQAIWAAFVSAMAQRYKSNSYLQYVVISGIGRRAESYFVTSPADITLFHSLGGLPKWEQAARWAIDLYASMFPNQFVLLDLGSPEPSEAGRASLKAVCDYGSQRYPDHFGVKSDGLSPGYSPEELGATEGLKLSATTLTGFQQGLPYVDQDLRDSITLANQFKAHLIEVYGHVCDDPNQTAILQSFTG